MLWPQIVSVVTTTPLVRSVNEQGELRPSGVYVTGRYMLAMISFSSDEEMPSVRGSSTTCLPLARQ